MLELEQIKASISQRFPILMIDRIISIEEGKKVVGIKNVTANEKLFLGHFPDKAVFPGSMIIEASAQVSTFLFYENKKPLKKLDFYLGVVKDMRFYKLVVPGDQLRIEAKSIRLVENSADVEVTVFVKEEKVASGELIFVRRKKD
ncbi:MAG: 3-hydroxyacyl-ACP dehydratase FabZ [Elusimicrobia bacterium]|nr:3-hydroxyacyl-ACP dehydratase FabZ [Elusimicrobiota bacterium]